MEAGFADGRVGMDGYVYQLHLPLACLHEGFESIGIGVVDLQAQRGNRMPGPMGPRPAGNTGIVPPHLRTPTGPRPMLSEGGKVKKGAAKAPPPPKKPPPKKSGRR